MLLDILELKKHSKPFEAFILHTGIIYINNLTNINRLILI